MTCFTSTLSPEANVLSQKSKARDFVCKTCVRKGHLYALPDVAIPAALCSAHMNCESVSTGFAFGYCCHIYYSIIQNCWGLSEFYSAAAMSLWCMLREYITCPKQRCLQTLPWLQNQGLLVTTIISYLILWHLGDTSLLEWVVFHQQFRVTFFFLNRVLFVLPHLFWSLPDCMLTWSQLHYSDWLSSELQWKIIDLMN